MGVYREGTRADEDRLLPIIARAPVIERGNVDNIQNIQLRSPASGRSIPIRQVVAGFGTDFEDGLIFRRNRRPTLTLHADQTEGESAIPLERDKDHQRKRLRAVVSPWSAA